MAIASAQGREREAEREERERRVEGVRASELGIGAHSRRTQRHGREVDACIGHGGGVAGAWATCQHFDEQLVGDGVPELGCHFWHIACRFRSDALKESCSPLDALQLVFRVQGH